MTHDLELMDKQLERLHIVPKVDAMNEYRNWSKKLPSFHFDKEWDVKIIPPFQGAIIRFYISYNGCMTKMKIQFHILNILMEKIFIDII